MPPFDRDRGYGPSPDMRAAWQIEHMAAAVAAASATSSAIANAQAQAQSQAMVRQATLTALQEHLAALMAFAVSNPQALIHLEAAEALAAELG